MTGKLLRKALILLVSLAAAWGLWLLIVLFIELAIHCPGAIK